jgi:hypothetical protein
MSGAPLDRAPITRDAGAPRYPGDAPPHLAIGARLRRDPLAHAGYGRVLPAGITLPSLREFDGGAEPCGNCFSRCDRASQPRKARKLARKERSL